MEEAVAGEPYQLKLFMLLSSSANAEVSPRRSPPKRRTLNPISSPVLIKRIKLDHIRQLMKNFHHQLEKTVSKTVAGEFFRLKLFMLLSKATNAKVSTSRSPPKLSKINIAQIREMKQSVNFQNLIKHKLKLEKMLDHNPSQLSFSDII